MLSCGPKITILLHENQVDLIIGKAHLEESLEAVLDHNIHDAILLDARHILLFWCHQINYWPWTYAHYLF